MSTSWVSDSTSVNTPCKDESSTAKKICNQIKFFSGEAWINEVTSDPDYKTDFKLDVKSSKDDSKGNGTVDLTKEKASKSKNKADEANDEEEMDIYEDVMKLEIKTQPLVQAIVLSDDDDDEETEKNAEKQTMNKDKVTKNNTAFPADKSGNKILNGTESKIAAPGTVVTKSGITATQNLVDDAKASTSAENDAEGQNSDDDTAIIIDDEVAESTARTRVYVRKRKLGSDNASDTTVLPKKEISTSSRKVWTAGRGIAENVDSNVETGADVSKEQEQPQTKSTDVPQESNANETSQAQPTNGKPLTDTSKSQPVQKPKRRLIAVSAASIAAGVLTGLGVSVEKDTSQKTG